MRRFRRSARVTEAATHGADLLRGLPVPDAVVFDSHLQFGPAEVHLRDEAGTVADDVLRDGSRQRRAVRSGKFFSSSAMS